MDARRWRRLLFTVLWFALLAKRPLFDPDEGRYAEIPREMLSGGDWVIPHLNALVYLEKPPLQYWLTALAFARFGQNEFTARLCTGLAGFLSLVAVFLLGRSCGDSMPASGHCLFTAASRLFVLLGHQMTLDMLLSFLLTAALGCFLMAQGRREASGHWRAWMLGCWAAMALAVLTKGLIGVLIPAATLGAYVVWQRDWLLLRRLNLALGTALVRGHRRSLVRSRGARECAFPEIFFCPRAFSALSHADRTSQRAVVVLRARAGRWESRRGCLRRRGHWRRRRRPRAAR